MRPTQLVLVAFLMLAASPAGAAEGTSAEGTSAEGAAFRADAVHGAYCSSVASLGVSQAAAANAEVSRVWEQVSLAYEEHGDTFLRYWRGVLGQCLGHEERAIEDLSAYVAAAKDDSVSVALVRDARRRLRRMGVKPEGTDPGRAAGAVALSGGGAAALLGAVLHGGAFEQGQLTRTDAGWGSELDRASYEAVVADWDGTSKAGFGLLIGGAAAVGVGALVLGLSSRRAEASSDGGVAAARRGRPAVGMAVLPMPQGFAVVLGGRF